MRKVFLDDLPRFKSNRHKKEKNGRIKWICSVGYKIRFIYDDIIGEIEICDYISSGDLLLKYKTNTLLMKTYNLMNCKIGSLIGKIDRIFTYSEGDVIKDTSGSLKILKQIKIDTPKSKLKGYEYECLICGNFGSILENNLKFGKGCSVCSNRKVLMGHNDIHTVAPWLGNLLWDCEDGYRYSCSSGIKLDFKCPECGEKISHKIINNVYRRGLNCNKCGDGISYPNKILYNFLKQIKYMYNITFEVEWTPSWSNNKRYDCMLIINNTKIVIEMQGEQHFRYTGFSRKFEEEQKNDRDKRKLAEENGYKYISIDCSKSEIDYISKSIVTSELSNYINMKKIIWDKIDLDATRSLVKVVCDFYNKGIGSSSNISKYVYLNRATISRYLKKGSKFGWCNYDPQLEKEKGNKRGRETRKRKIVQLKLDGEYIAEYASITDASQQLNLKSTGGICEACKGTVKTIGGFRWMYKEDYERYIEQ